MGSIPYGINGPIIGKVGTVHGSSRHGKGYIKGPYKKRTEVVSDKELDNRNKFAEAQYWLKPVLDYVREGFSNYAPTVRGFIAAKKELMHNSWEGTGEDMRINPALVKLSYGKLPLSDDIVVEKEGTDQLRFSWNPEEVTGGSRYDQVMLLAYDIDNKQAWHNITGQFRTAGTDTLKIKSDAGKTYHLYFAFTAADRKMQSDSVYLGTISY